MTSHNQRRPATLLADQPALVEAALSLGLAPAYCLRTRGCTDPSGEARPVSVENPWLFRLQDERAELAYSVGARWLAPLLCNLPADLRDGTLHDWLYFLGEDLTVGVLAARAVAESDIPRDTTTVVPDGWLGRAAQAALALLERDAVSAPAAAVRATKPRARVSLKRFSRAVDVLVVEAYGNRLRNMSELIEALVGGGMRVGVLNLARQANEQDAVDDVARQLDLECRHWTAWSPATLRPRVGAIAARRVLRVTRALASLGSLTISGLVMPEDVRRAAVRQAALSTLRMASLAALFGAVLAEVAPRLVVTGRGDDTILRALGPTAERANVTVVDVQHGLRHGSPSALLRDIHGVHLAVFGGASRDAYVEAGVDPSYVHTVGSLFFDRMQREERPPSVALPGPFVTYSSAVVHAHKRYEPDAAHLAVLEAIDGALDDLPELHAAVRPHPQEDVQAAATTVARMRNGRRVHVVADGSNAWLFRRASAHVSVGSTTSIEAAALGTPALLYTGADISRSFEEGIALGAVTPADDVQSLREGLVRFAKTPRENVTPNSAFVAAYLHSVDGQTVDRILALEPVRAALA